MEDTILKKKPTWFRKNLQAIKRIVFVAVIIPLILVNGYFFGRLARLLATHIGTQVGLVQDFSYISGTGSMYPTFPKGHGETTLEKINETVGGVQARVYPGGITFAGKTFFDYTLQRGDIVFFANEKTREIIQEESSGAADLSIGFVKRIIGLPGDTLEIRDGFVWLNGAFLHEPYIAKPRSTYGGDFLPDCQKVTLPENTLFVAGDNRKESNDSRFDLGLIRMSDVSRVIPITEQDHLKQYWRDTTHDPDFANVPTLDLVAYLDMLNQRRAENQLSPLTYTDSLSESAGLRADVILKYDDISFEATRSGYTMQDALREVGYSNIVWGEAPTFGYYTSEELIENSFHFPDSREFLMNPDFQEIGLAAKIGTVNGCPTQVIVQHFAGYIPPNYTESVIESWRTLKNTLSDILPSWKNIRNHEEFYRDHKGDTDRILEIIETRIARASQIVARMDANLWLTNELQQYVKEDEALYKEQELLAKKLNDL